MQLPFYMKVMKYYMKAPQRNADCVSTRSLTVSLSVSFFTCFFKSCCKLYPTNGVLPYF